MKFPKYRLPAALVMVGLLHAPAMAQTVEPQEALDVSYIYAAVMGSGTYKINDLRISMLKVPFSYTQQELTREQPGIRWELPVVLGYDALQNEEWVNRFLEDELVTLTILPGFEVMQHLTDVWVFKPFGNLGMSYDFTRGESVLMGVLGIRMLGTWKYVDASELRVGSSVRYAAEYQIQSDQGLGFSMWEVGFDYRRDTHIRVISRDTNAGVYWRSQFFMPQWTLQKFRRGEETSVALIHEIGVSVGLRHPFKKWGLSASRIRTGFQFGDNVRGWTFGTDFPF
jgi:hypothetical protein